MGEARGRIDMPAFHNLLRVLHSIDYGELVRAQVIAGGDIEKWTRFRTDPARFFIEADDPTTARLWMLMERRHAAGAAAAGELMTGGGYEIVLEAKGPGDADWSVLARRSLAGTDKDRAAARSEIAWLKMAWPERCQALRDHGFRVRET